MRSADVQSTVVQRSAPRPSIVILCVAGLIALFFWIQSWNLPATHHDGGWLLPDPDDYMRLCRVQMILDGQATIVRNIPSLHPPRGTELHWTAPLDFLILAAVRIASLGGDARGRLLSVGAWLPVGLGALYLSLAMTLLYRAVGATVATLAGAMIVLSPGFEGAFRLGHCDHHCLLELCMMLSLYLWLAPRARSASEPSGLAAIAGGCFIGMAIWVSVLAMVAWAVVLAGATFATYHASPDRRAIWARLRLQWALAALATVAIGWTTENAPTLWRLSADKISILHVAILTLALFLPAGSAEARVGKSARWIVFIVVAAACGLWVRQGYGEMSRLFHRPEFYRWSGMVAELQPLILRGVNGWSIMPVLRYLGLLPLVLPIALWMLHGDTRIHCMAKVSFGLLATIMTGLSIAQLRWADHFMLAIAPVTALGLTRLAARLFPDESRPRAAVRWTFVGYVAAIFVFPSAAGTLTPPGGEPDPFMTRLVKAIDAIKRRQSARPVGPATIMCEYDAGPILLFETGLPVVAGPYHRCLDGVVDVARFYSERDDATARAELSRLGVGYVVVPYVPAHQLRIFETIAFGELHSYERAEWWIKNGEPFESITLKPEVARTIAYRLTQCTGTESLGLKPLEKIREGANTLDHLSGLVYVVEP